MTDSVAILMATYNGEKYIKEQLNSILKQTYSNFTLFIRDDGSSDSTERILLNFSKKDERITLIEKEGIDSGQLNNFSVLMDSVIDFDYIFFSDQDDIWMDDKIERSLRAIKYYGNNKPLLLYTNYNNFDDDTKVREPYFQKNWTKNNKNIFVQNWIMGCTSVINRQLLSVSLKVPFFAINHDNWLANVAAMCGEIHYLSDVTMDHRIHDNNVTTRVNHNSFNVKFSFLISSLKNRKQLLNNRIQLVDELDKRIKDNESLDVRDDFRQYKQVMCTEKGVIASLKKGIEFKFCGVTNAQTLIFYLLLLSK